MEVETMDTSERLERVKRRMKACEASKISGEKLQGVVNGMERAVDLGEEIVEQGRV